MEINKDLFIEQILSYTLQSHEILSHDSFFEKSKNNYNNFLLPSGSDLYTGPLKAAGYLFIEATTKTIIMVKKQDLVDDKITIYAGSDIVFLGRKISFSKFGNISGLQKTKVIDEEILKQIYFIRILKPVENVVVLGVGKKVCSSDILKCILRFKSDSNVPVIFYENGSSNNTFVQSKKIDQVFINQLILQEEYSDQPNWLGNTFINLSNHYSKNINLLGYFNTGDIGTNKNDVSGYFSMAS